MGRWLDALRNFHDTSPDRTDKTDKTPLGQVLSVLSVPVTGIFEKSEGSSEGFVSFVSTADERFREFFSGWDDLDFEIWREERAGFLEHDEGLSRIEASRLARQQVEGLKAQLGVGTAGLNRQITVHLRTVEHEST